MSKKNKSVPREEVGTYVYLGPSIRGVISYGEIFTGTRSEVEKMLPQNPDISKLVVKDDEIAAAKQKLKSTSSLSMAYKRLCENS